MEGGQGYSTLRPKFFPDAGSCSDGSVCQSITMHWEQLFDTGLALLGRR